MEQTMHDRLRGRVDGKVAVVTGGGTTEIEDPVTFGYAIAAVLAAGGAKVVVLDRDGEAADRSVKRIVGRGDVATAVVADISSTPDCEAAIEQTRSIYGDVNILVNNAAIIGKAWTVADDDVEFERTMDINWMGAIRMCRASVPHMPVGSSIVNIASTGAVRSFGMVDYSSAKGALLGATFTLSVQLGPSGIRVNSVSPGTAWAQIGLRRLESMGATPDEIAEQRALRASSVPLGTEGSGWDIALAVMYLASDESRWVSGQDLTVDAGLSRVGFSSTQQR